MLGLYKFLQKIFFTELVIIFSLQKHCPLGFLKKIIFLFDKRVLTEVSRNQPLPWVFYLIHSIQHIMLCYDLLVQAALNMEHV